MSEKDELLANACYMNCRQFFNISGGKRKEESRIANVPKRTRSTTSVPNFRMTLCRWEAILEDTDIEQ